jgi:hypothetical protein
LIEIEKGLFDFWLPLVKTGRTKNLFAAKQCASNESRQIAEYLIRKIK